MTEVTFFETQKAFEHWLSTHPTAQEVWVGYYKKSTKRTGMTWSQSVDAALSFGWIDGIRKSIDAQSYMIRFTPRKIDSVWSAVNVAKAEHLIQTGKMTDQGLRLFNARTDKEGYTASDRNVPLPAEFEAEIRSNPTAWAYFDALAPSYKRDTIWWVMSAKRPETRLRRLTTLIATAADGQKIPMLQKK